METLLKYSVILSVYLCMADGDFAEILCDLIIISICNFNRVSLVNESIVTYFLSELQIENHFKALRRYLCMADRDC